jgi:hypothetical protein
MSSIKLGLATKRPSLVLARTRYVLSKRHHDIMTLCISDTEHNNIQPNDAQYNGLNCNIQHNDTQHDELN